MHGTHSTILKKLHKVLLLLFVFTFCFPFSPARAKEVRLSLAEAIGLALEHNEDIHESFRRISAAEAAAMAAKGVNDLNAFSSARYGSYNSLSQGDYAAYDVTNAAKSYLRTDTGLKQRTPTGGSISAYHTYSNERRLGAFNQRGKHDKSYVTLELVQSLLKGIGDKENKGAIENALLTVKDSEEGKNLIISQVVLGVIRAYWMLETAQHNLTVSKKVLEMAHEVHRREIVRFEQGISQGVDVDRALMAVRQREYAMLQYTRDVGVAQEQLAMLINYPQYNQSTAFLPTSSPPNSVVKLPDAQQSFALALKNRYELKQLAILLKQLDIEYDINTNKLLPVLDVNGGYTFSNGNDYLRGAENFKDTKEQGSWFVGASFMYPLQNREARGNVRKTKQLIRIAGDRIDKTRRSVETDVRDSLHNLVLAKDGIPVAQSAYDAARQTMSGEIKRFEMGGVNNRDLLASHDALAREEINYHAAVVGYSVAKAEYNYACALLLTQYGITVGKDSARIAR